MIVCIDEKELNLQLSKKTTYIFKAYMWQDLIKGVIWQIFQNFILKRLYL